jgi:carbamoyltransferase
MGGAYLGPRFTGAEAAAALEAAGAVYRRLPEDDLIARVADLLAAGKVVGWLQGPMEFGPRALGGRSILADPRSREMQSQLNLKIKYRESFRPFAPAILAERVGDWFEHDRPSPYMLMVAPLREAQRLPVDPAEAGLFGLDRLKLPRSRVPAVTHVDYSARLQTVHRETNRRFHRLIDAFAARTGVPMLVNTSFNVRGEPIVATPTDAWRCFMRTDMDHLVVEDCLLDKADQAPWQESPEWRRELVLD